MERPRRLLEAGEYVPPVWYLYDVPTQGTTSFEIPDPSASLNSSAAYVCAYKNIGGKRYYYNYAINNHGFYGSNYQNPNNGPSLADALGVRLPNGEQASPTERAFH
ncbi:MAG: hypothetical protein R2827_08640 [Bdellovibrionales bacterium]